MNLRLACVWSAVTAAFLVVVICHSLAWELGGRLKPHSELPLISAVFFPNALAVYLFPLPLAIWAAFHSVKNRGNSDLGILIVTVTLSLCLIFIAAFMLAMALPFMPIGHFIR